MILKLTYPNIYQVDITESASMKLHTVTDGKKITDEYDVNDITKITLHITLRDKRHNRYKIRILKRNWFHPIAPSFVSCDAKLNEQYIGLGFKKTHMNSELILTLETDYVMNSVNSYTDKLKLNVVRKKMVYIEHILYYPADKRNIISLIFMLILTFLCNISLPLILAISMIYEYFYQPDLLWGIEEKYLIVSIILLILTILHTVRFIKHLHESISFYKLAG